MNRHETCKALSDFDAPCSNKVSRCGYLAAAALMASPAAPARWREFLRTNRAERAFVLPFTEVRALIRDNPHLRAPATFLSDDSFDGMFRDDYPVVHPSRDRLRLLVFDLTPVGTADGNGSVAQLRATWMRLIALEAIFRAIPHNDLWNYYFLELIRIENQIGVGSRQFRIHAQLRLNRAVNPALVLAARCEFDHSFAGRLLPHDGQQAAANVFLARHPCLLAAIALGAENRIRTRYFCELMSLARFAPPIIGIVTLTVEERRQLMAFAMNGE